ANAAVGIIGSEGNPANLMYVGVIAVGMAGAFVACFQADAMARAMLATAIAQTIVTAIALIYDLGAPSSGANEILLLNGLFITLWIGSALLFRNAAAREQSGRKRAS
ncbi:MAG: hypothetical protein R3338_07815, partial [Thermoanaerobaculia bacterium]|nr:hypothetical protein [Thermoanaerobaculia bacterium]